AKQKKKTGTKGTELSARARTHLLRAQCNDAYWHGVFGGLYSPHLRTECWRELIRAEALMNGARNRRGSIAIEKLDFDADGCEEIYVTSRELAALIKPDDGATIAMLDFRPTAIAAVNSLRRRPEAYHGRLSETANSDGGGVASIHDRVRVKEPGLEKLLRYDKWPRHCFRVFLFPEDKQQADCVDIRLGENPSIAGGTYDVDLSSDGVVKCAITDDSGTAGSRLRVEKIFSFAPGDDRVRIHCRINIKQDGSQAVRCRCGVENVLNLLAPDAPDRYFEASSGRHSMNWNGIARDVCIRAVDEWQNFEAEISAPGAEETWIVPIETVSESEEGFERVYQGSQIMSVWRAEISAGGEWSCEISLDMAKAHA
ncbi:MAG TPA: alpha-amylase/4-alpha-glucanotransferase domain-containing protein, partial [Candidatus Acidoferrales bacterium]|nr:alpha-amylase/4-alpha-glucanotransferase domain-containing protein [Candidatus Acidoferrales bacterium]